MQDYIEAFHIERKRADFDLEDFLNGLAAEQLNRLIEDIVTENEKVYEIFLPSKNIDSDEIGFRFVRKMSHNTFAGARDFLEAVFLNAVQGTYRNPDKVINNILALTGRRKEGLSSQFIMLQLHNDKVANHIKTRLAILLSKIQDSPSMDFFETGINYKAQPYLLPAFISAFKNNDPLKAFAKLAEINERPANFDLFRTPITTALDAILLRKKEFIEFKNIYHKLGNWAKKEVDEILNTGFFLKKNIRQAISNFNEGKK